MVRWTMVACGARDANEGASFSPIRCVPEKTL